MISVVHEHIVNSDYVILYDIVAPGDAPMWGQAPHTHGVPSASR
jgi:hypothetical protein